MTLTRRQREALDVIQRLRAPSIREIAAALRVAYNAARQLVLLLERHGAITRTPPKLRSRGRPGKRRSIKVAA